MTSLIHFANNPDLRIYDRGKLVAFIPDHLLPALILAAAQRLRDLSIARDWPD